MFKIIKLISFSFFIHNTSHAIIGGMPVTHEIVKGATVSVQINELNSDKI